MNFRLMLSTTVFSLLLAIGSEADAELFNAVVSTDDKYHHSASFRYRNFNANVITSAGLAGSEGNWFWVVSEIEDPVDSSDLDFSIWHIVAPHNEAEQNSFEFVIGPLGPGVSLPPQTLEYPHGSHMDKLTITVGEDVFNAMNPLNPPVSVIEIALRHTPEPTTSALALAALCLAMSRRRAR